jgi:hypothetical protein
MVRHFCSLNLQSAGWVRGPPVSKGTAIEGHHCGGYHEQSICGRKEIGNCMTRRLLGLTLRYLPVLVSTVLSLRLADHAIGGIGKVKYYVCQMDRPLD